MKAFQLLAKNKIQVIGITILLFMAGYLFSQKKDAKSAKEAQSAAFQPIIDTLMVPNNQEARSSIKMDSLFLDEKDLSALVPPNTNSDDDKTRAALEQQLSRIGIMDGTAQQKKQINSIDIEEKDGITQDKKQNQFFEPESSLIEACIVNDTKLQNQGYLKIRLLKDFTVNKLYLPHNLEFFAKANLTGGKIILESEGVKIDNDVYRINFDVMDYYDVGDGITYQQTKKEQRKQQSQQARAQIQNQLLNQAEMITESKLQANSPLPIGSTGVFSSLGLLLRRNNGMINTAKVDIPAGYKIYLQIKI